MAIVEKSLIGRKVHELRSQGLSHNKIAQALKCSKGTVAFHLTPGEKANKLARSRKAKEADVLGFKLRDFHKPYRGKKGRQKFLASNPEMPAPAFTTEEFRAKIGQNPIDYLTGKPIDLNDANQYSPDHIIPRTRGCTNTLDNANITSRKVNLCKNNLLNSEFIEICRDVVNYNGYIAVPVNEQDKFCIDWVHKKGYTIIPTALLDDFCEEYVKTKHS